MENKGKYEQCRFVMTDAHCTVSSFTGDINAVTGDVKILIKSDYKVSTRRNTRGRNWTMSNTKAILIASYFGEVARSKIDQTLGKIGRIFFCINFPASFHIWVHCAGRTITHPDIAAAANESAPPKLSAHIDASLSITLPMPSFHEGWAQITSLIMVLCRAYKGPL